MKHGQNANCLESDRFVVEQQIRGLGWRQIRRYCGNWNEKLKAIHVVTKTSSIRIGSMLYPMHKNEKSRRGFVAKVGVVCASPHEYKQQRPNKRFLTRELHCAVLNILNLPLLYGTMLFFLAHDLKIQLYNILWYVLFFWSTSSQRAKYS